MKTSYLDNNQEVCPTKEYSDMCSSFDYIEPLELYEWMEFYSKNRGKTIWYKKNAKKLIQSYKKLISKNGL